MKNYLAIFADEVGLLHLVHSGLDTKILLVQRLIRFLAYGSSTLILVLFLRALDIEESKIGLFMTLTLFGDVLISLILTVKADALGRRWTLALGAALMTASGVVFALNSNYWVLLGAAVVGVITPLGNEIGPFRAIEESTLSALTGKEERTGVFAWYAVFGYAGASFGVLFGGLALKLAQTKWGWSALQSYRLIFWAYAMFGAMKFTLCLMLSDKCEVQKLKEEPVSDSEDEDEQRPLLSEQHPNGIQQPEGTRLEPKKARFGKLAPQLSKQSVSIVWKMCLLFMLDSIASGLTPASWVTYFFHQKFGLSDARLGTLFFVCNLLSTFSNLGAAPLAKRIGLIKTMVFTHVPASIALGLLPVPNGVGFAIMLLFIRYLLNSMDQAPRQAFIAAAVLPEERTAVMGIVNVVKTLSQSLGPVMTGVLAQNSLFWVSFVTAGSLKLLYDFLMLALFLGYRTVEEEAEEALDAGNDEEEGADARAR